MLILSWFCRRLCVRNPRGKELLKRFHRLRPQGLKRKALGTSARAVRKRTSVILAENCETSRLLQHAVVVETSYQKLEVLSFCDRERAQPPSITIKVITLLVEKVLWSFLAGRLLFENTWKNFKWNIILLWCCFRITLHNVILSQKPVEIIVHELPL